MPPLQEQADRIQNIPKSKRRKDRSIIIALCAALIMVPTGMSFYENAAAKNQKKVVIGTSNFTEALILGYMYSELIETNRDMVVEQRFNLNGASVCFDALDNDEDTMASLNAEVDIEGRNASDVAHDFLAEKGLVP